MLTELETSLLGIMMIIIMLGMGASLTFKDFAIALRRPHGIAVGMICQYGLMPLTAFLLSIAFGLAPAYAIGLILMGCMPGGTTSNIFVYFSKGRLSLSILMTVCSTLMAIVMVPVTLGLYGRGIEGDWAIPVSEVVKLLFVLLVPTLIGIAIRKWNANVGAVIELFGSILGVVVIVFLLASWIPRNWELLTTTAGSIFFVSIALGLIGFLLGYGLSRSLRLNPVRSRTVSMETGIQNGPLAILIVAMVLTGDQQAHVLLIPILYSIFIVLSSTAITFWYRAMTTAEELARDQAKIGAIGGQ
ncbi:MAG: transporter [Deltaproteobacteria bacterium]|nr:MAG: transporter [Deltaproteobacteria bacterium]